METTSISEGNLLLKFIQQNPLTTIILGGEDLLITHTPILNSKSDEFLLFGHIRKDNPQYKYLEDGKSALIIFESQDPSIADRNSENTISEYSAVHVNGKITLQSDDELRVSFVETLEVLRKFHGYENSEYHLKEEFLDKQRELVTGFYCKPTLINPILKLKTSQ